jgi:hypothetical protein
MAKFLMAPVASRVDFGRQPDGITAPRWAYCRHARRELLAKVGKAWRADRYGKRQITVWAPAWRMDKSGKNVHNNAADLALHVVTGKRGDACRNLRGKNAQYEVATVVAAILFSEAAGLELNFSGEHAPDSFARVAREGGPEVEFFVSDKVRMAALRAANALGEAFAAHPSTHADNHTR